MARKSEARSVTSGKASGSMPTHGRVVPSRPVVIVLVLALVPIAGFLSMSGDVAQYLPATLQKMLPASVFPDSDKPTLAVFEDTAYTRENACEKHKYTTEIVSLDPLVIYINNFTSAAEAEGLIEAGSADFEDSFISRSTGNSRVTGRTSQSAPLEPDIPLVSCILSRARTFMGTMLLPQEPFSVPQLVRYFPSQRYDLHTDFWPRHQLMNDGSGRKFNRVASFFVFLRDNCTQGETYFPLVDVLDTAGLVEGRGRGLDEIGGGKWMQGEKDGEVRGVKFRPMRGNAVFWVNLDAEGNGDRRLVHAGLPVGEGEKIGLNIWPRKFYA